MELLEEVRGYLRVESDGQNDAPLEGIITRGKARLQAIAGAPLDFAADDLPRQLLLDYCRYAHSRALEMFEINFGAELLSLRYDYIKKEEGENDANQNTNPL